MNIEKRGDKIIITDFEGREIELTIKQAIDFFNEFRWYIRKGLH